MRARSPTRPIPEPPLVPGGWLHLDVSQGCTASLLCAALLDLGAPEAALRDALTRAGLHGFEMRRERRAAGGVRGTTLRWADPSAAAPGEPPCLRGSELLDTLGGCDLPPLPKATALQGLRRALHGLARLQRVALEALEVPAEVARLLRIEVVACAALIDAISPARVTASAVGVSSAPVTLLGEVMPGPSPWLLATLEGMHVVERELAPEDTSPGAVAMLGALAHRVGGRPEWQVGRLGMGVGDRGSTARCHAHYGPAPTLATREGEEPRERRAHLRAHLPADAPRSALWEALTELGATAGAWHPAQSAAGAPLALLECALPMTALDGGVELLFRVGGAYEVLVGETELHRMGVRCSTVRVGRRNRGHALRVREHRYQGELLAAEPVADDVLEAARVLGWPPARIRAAALGAWAALSGAPTGDDQA